MDSEKASRNPQGTGTAVQFRVLATPVGFVDDDAEISYPLHESAYSTALAS
jgi:hypothetical protein